MLYLKKIETPIKEFNSPESDIFFVNTAFYQWGGGLYVYLGYYCEIGLNGYSGEIHNITVEKNDNIYMRKEPLFKPGIEEKRGTPCFTVRKSWLIPGEIMYVSDDEHKPIEIYMGERFVTAVFWEHPIAFIVRNYRTSFFFDSNRGLCAVQKDNLTDEEIAAMAGHISYGFLEKKDLPGTNNYAFVMMCSVPPLLLKDIGPQQEHALDFSTNTLASDYSLKITLDNTYQEPENSLYWHLGKELVLKINKNNGSVISLEILDIPIIYRIVSLGFLNNACEKEGRPLFKTKAYTQDHIFFNETLLVRPELFIEDNALSIILIHHHPKLYIHDKDITYGVSNNKVLCFIKIKNLESTQIAFLEDKLSANRRLIQAQDSTLNYSIIKNDRGTALQLQAIESKTEETISIGNNRHLHIVFCQNNCTPEETIFLEENNFFEFIINRKSGKICSFSLCDPFKLCKGKTTSLFKIKKSYSGFPVFKTLGWVDRFYQQLDCNLFLYQTSVRIIFLYHEIETAITNDRVSFYFNAQDSLCALEINNMTEQEMNTLLEHVKYSTIKTVDQITSVFKASCTNQ